MNKVRRTRFNEVIDVLTEAIGVLDDIRTEETEAYDSLPEGLRFAPVGEQMMEYVDLMDEVEDKIDNVVLFIEEHLIKP